MDTRTTWGDERDFPRLPTQTTTTDPNNYYGGSKNDSGYYSWLRKYYLNQYGTNQPGLNQKLAPSDARYFNAYMQGNVSGSTPQVSGTFAGQNLATLENVYKRLGSPNAGSQMGNASLSFSGYNPFKRFSRGR